MNKKPIWLLDVDGVLNGVGAGAFPEFVVVKARANGRSWPIAYRPTVIAFILRMIEQGLVDVHWLTTWGREANGDLSEKLGLPGDWPVVGEPDHGALGWWKWDLVKRSPEAHGRPVVWTDDDLPWSREAQEFVRANDPEVLAIAPDTRYGLTDAHLDEIEAFLALANAV